MSRVGTGLIFALGLFLGVVSWAPWIDSFELLKKEAAYIVDVRRDGSGSSVTRLATASGRDIRCVHSKTGGCPTELMQSLMNPPIEVLVWHDGESVLQLVVGDRVVLPYDHVHQGRWFGIGLSILLLVIGSVRVGIHLGLIGAVKRSNQPLRRDASQ
ncbi:MAG: hypothetical protein HXY26_01785 [Hydrogenophilaceae bacterium]|nr:hypothetical protein [Hydrogenophilaceae bacterium]